MHRHLSLSYFADSHGNGFDGRGVVWIDGYGDLATLSPPLNNDAAAARSAKLPSARLLAGYLVVVSTFSRCAEQSVKLGRGDVELEFASSPLLELRWLRLIVDEGARCGAARGWRSIAATRRGAPFNGSFARLCVCPVLFFSRPPHQSRTRTVTSAAALPAFSHRRCRTQATRWAAMRKARRLRRLLRARRRRRAARGTTSAPATRLEAATARKGRAACSESARLLRERSRGASSRRSRTPLVSSAQSLRSDAG